MSLLSHLQSSRDFSSVDLPANKFHLSMYCTVYYILSVYVEFYLQTVLGKFW